MEVCMLALMSSFNAIDTIALLCVFSLVYSWVSHRKHRSNGLPLPPGPRRLPVIGSFFDAPMKDQWEIARQWGEIYGDIIYMEIFGTRYIFVNSFEYAIELLEKRSNIYSDRPRTTMLELEGWCEWDMGFMPLGDQFQKFRQYFNIFFQKSSVKNHHEVQIQSTHRLLLKLVDNPHAYRAHVKHWAAEAIIKVSYGFDIVENDPYVEIADKSIDAISDSLTFSVVNVLPALRFLPSWFPGASFQKRIQEGYKLSNAVTSIAYNEAKRNMANGTASPSVTSQLLEMSEDGEGKHIDEAFIVGTTAVAYSGGTETSIAALLTFILAMVLYPNAMKKAQEELDRVLGRNNLPTFEDRPRLPYIEAICSECLRWQGIAPTGLPHMVEKDDVFNGYFIPAGTTILANMWAMLRDPKRYPDPEKFIPERWLTLPDQGRPLDVNRIVFGFGRRICPGRFFAENSLFIGVASILAVFDIQKATDENGVPITPSEDFVSTLVRHPKPFKCKIIPRSDEVVDLIHQVSSAAKLEY